MSELKLDKCPFCGGEAKLYKQEFSNEAFYEVACSNSDCTYLITQKRSEQAAVKAWNTRHEPKVVAELEAERDEYKEEFWVMLRTLEGKTKDDATLSHYIKEWYKMWNRLNKTNLSPDKPHSNNKG